MSVIWFYMVVVLVALLVLTNLVAAQTEHPAQKPILVDAFYLVGDYLTNEIAADVKYKGKAIAVHGKIRSVSKVHGGYPLVIIDPGSQRFTDVHCFFPKHAESDVARLKAGDSIMIGGVVDGLKHDVHLLGCILIK